MPKIFLKKYLVYLTDRILNNVFLYEEKERQNLFPNFARNIHILKKKIFPASIFRE